MGIAVFIVVVIFTGAGGVAVFWLRRDAQQIERERVGIDKIRAGTERIAVEKSTATEDEKTLA
jgi:hypothetical protein